MLLRAFTLAVFAGGLCAGQVNANDALNEAAKRASCLIEANSIVKLSSSIQGTLAKIEVARGDEVKKGQVVARLESDVEEAMVEAAELKARSSVIIQAKEAEMRNAQSKLQRTKELSSKQIASVQALEEAQANAEVSLLAVEQARFEKTMAELEAKRIRAQIERRIIRSPVDGVVTKVDLHAGEYADPAAAIAVIAEVRPLLVQLYLPIEAFPLVKLGAQVEVKPQEPIGGTYMAELSAKDPQIDAASSLFQVTLTLPNADGKLPSGLRCTVRFK
jgi:RND family efflux transporter MFP subunit